jgi:flagellar M-ring protein FliF
VNAFLDTMRNLGVLRLAAMGAVAAALIAFFLFLAARLSTGEEGLLYADLDLADAGEIASQLDGLGVPYSIAGGGTAIMVPKGEVDRLRLVMAEEGLPKGGSLGYEIFDRGDGFGATSFMQNINRLRALEGELARTISTIANVRQARVHLVLPERALFSRETEAPSASVFLRLAGGGLGPDQIIAIQHLVAASVPQLKPQDISIVDDRGNLLARGPGGEGELQAASAEEMRRDYERKLRERIEEMLSRSLGFGKVRAQVAVEMDFDRVTTEAELFDPNGQVPRSTQLVEEEQDASDGETVDPVSVTTNLPEADALGPLGAAGSSSRSSRTEEVTNFEISRTIRNTVSEGGRVERLSVAVLVDGTWTEDEAGELQWQPRTEEELAQLEALVRSAVGFNAERGDTLELVNMRFVEAEGGEVAGALPSTLLGLDRADIMKIVELLVLGVVAGLVILLVVRPVLTRVLETGRTPAIGAGDEIAGLLPDQSGALPRALTGPAGAIAAIGTPGLEGRGGEGQEGMIDLSQVEGRVRASHLKKVGEIVEKHPEEAVSIIRNWIYQEG